MRVLNAKVLGLLVAALVAMALLLVAPLSSLASARVEARAGDAVAIAGDDDCNVETNDDGDNTDDGNTGDDGNDDGDDTDEGDDTGDEGDADGDAEEDDISGTQDGDNVTLTQYEDEDNGDGDNDQAQDEDNGGSQDGNGGAVARAGDVVAIAGSCDSETQVIEENVEEVIEENIEIGGEDDTEDVDSEDDDEISDLTGLQDGNTVNTSNLSTLTIEGESSNRSETAARENGFGFGGTLGSGNESRRGKSPSLSDWPFPERDEMRRLGEPRRFDADPDAAMTLSIRTLKLYDVPVIDSNTRKGLGRGVVHAPDTAYPWDEGDQKNVFLTGHRLGSPAKDSRMIFYQLDELKRGDEIFLKDGRGQSYKYRVRELFKVDAGDTWVADTQVGRDLLTLQTSSLPDFQDRLVVRADRVQPGRE